MKMEKMGEAREDGVSEATRGLLSGDLPSSTWSSLVLALFREKNVSTRVLRD